MNPQIRRFFFLVCAHSAALAALSSCGEVTLPDEGREQSLFLDEVSPKTAPTTGGTAITLVGEGFVAGDTHVLIGGVLVTDVEVVSEEVLYFLAPSREEASEVDVSVFNAQGTASLSQALRYVPPALVTAVEPRLIDPEFGGSITISGQGFVDGAGLVEVLLDGTPAEVTVEDDGNLTVDVPVGGSPFQEAELQITSRNGSLTESFSYYPSGLVAQEQNSSTWLHIDPDTAAIQELARDASGARATGMGSGPDNRIFASHPSHGAVNFDHVSEIDPLTGEETVIFQVGTSRIADVAIGADGTLFLSRGLNAPNGTSVFNVNLAGEQLGAPADFAGGVGGNALASDADGRIFFAPGGTDGDLLRLNGASFVNEVSLTGVPPNNEGLRSMTFLGDRLFAVRKAIFEGGSQSVLVEIDMSTGDITDITRLPGRVDGLAAINL